MIIWGTYVMKKNLRSGQFYCPGCKTKRGFKLLRPRKWGHLYWIPLIPMQDFDSYVECSSCQGNFVEAALDYDPERQEREWNTGMATMLVQCFLQGVQASGHPTDRQEINEHVRTLLGLDTLPEGAGTAAPLGLEDVLDLARRFGGGLTETGKERVLRDAGGPPPFSEATRDWLRQMGTAFGMTAAHVNGLLAEIDPGALAAPATRIGPPAYAGQPGEAGSSAAAAGPG